MYDLHVENGVVYTDEDRADQLFMRDMIGLSSIYVDAANDIFLDTPGIGESIIISGSSITWVSPDIHDMQLMIDRSIADYIPHDLGDDILVVARSSDNAGIGTYHPGDLWGVPQDNMTWFGIPINGSDPLYWYGVDEPYEFISDDSYHLYIRKNDLGDYTLSLLEGVDKYKVAGPVLNTWDTDRDAIIDYLKLHAPIPRVKTSAFSDVDIISY